MRFLPGKTLFILTLALSPCLADPAPNMPDGKFTPVVPMWEPILGRASNSIAMSKITILDPAREKLVKDGITLKQLVDAFGPGYEKLDDGVIRWYFSDTQTLCAKPAKRVEGEVLTFAGKDPKTFDDKMWWFGPPREKTDKFVPCITVDDFFYFTLKPLDASKESVIREGVTLKELVDALGPGYMRENEGIGLFGWRFSDGRALITHDYAENTPLSHKNGTLRWSPEPGEKPQTLNMPATGK